MSAALNNLHVHSFYSLTYAGAGGESSGNSTNNVPKTHSSNANTNFVLDFGKAKELIGKNLQKAPDQPLPVVQSFSYVDTDGSKVVVNSAEQYKIFRHTIEGKKTTQDKTKDWLKVTTY